MKSFLIFPAIFLTVGLVNSISDSSFYTRLVYSPQDEYSCTILASEKIKSYKGFKRSGDANEIKISSRPATQIPYDSNKHSSDSYIVEIYSKNIDTLEAHLNTFCKTRKTVPILNSESFQNPPEIVKIIDGGDQANRIDVVFMGDGYQASEREEFFQDIRRLTDDMFRGTTFQSYLPLFNIWAVYVESVDSGIGYDGAKNTPFRLYREAGQLRVIWPGNPNLARQICQSMGPSGCDYPSLIANDDFYGGLGGEFVISSRSNRTGNIVLRHEMGHNFANVGDEYDNSWAYFGANSANSLASVPWRHWMGDNQLIEEKAIYRLLEYPWHDLSLGARNFNFTSDGTYHRWYLQVSVSAAGEADSLEFTLDGEPLPWTSTGFDDREFYSWDGLQGLSAGQHSFSVRSKTPPTNGQIPRMICSITLHEMGDETEFHEEKNYISAYPTWDDQKGKTLRPTNAGCLMRNMSHSEFCPICKESMWLSFLEQVSLIDDLQMKERADGVWEVQLNTLKLAQFREVAVEGEKLVITWKKDGIVQPLYQDRFYILADTGAWNVEVKFESLEIRQDPLGLTVEEENFII